MQEKSRNQPVSSREMRALETNAEYFGIALLQLMENAGRNIAEEVAKNAAKGKRVAIFCGLGGNGGDGFVAARHLLTRDFEVTIVLAGKSRDISHESTLQNWRAIQPLQDKIAVFEVSDSSAIPKITADIVVDALLGTGTKGKLKAPIRQMVEYINSLSAFKIAVDVPTGIDSDNGDVLGAAVKADLTITFYKSKLGLEKAKKYVGEYLSKALVCPWSLKGLLVQEMCNLPRKSVSRHRTRAILGDCLLLGEVKFFLVHQRWFRWLPCGQALILLMLRLQQRRRKPFLQCRLT